MIGQMAIAIAQLPEFTGLDARWLLFFFPETDITSIKLFLLNYYYIIYNYLQFPKNEQKSTWEIKKNSRFLSTGHRIRPSFSCKARELWSLIHETSPVD